MLQTSIHGRGTTKIYFMIRRIGYLVSTKQPHIYFLVKGNYLYIGETLGFPVTRWAAHISDNGTFTLRLQEKDYDAWQCFSPIFMFAYSSALFNDVASSERKHIARFIEHKIHVHTVCDKFCCTRFIVISDTTRTAPISCKYDWAEKVSYFFLDAFKYDYQLQSYQL